MAFDPYEWEAIDWDDPEDEDGNYAHCLRHDVDELVVDEVLRERPVAIKLSPVWAEFVIAGPNAARSVLWTLLFDRSWKRGDTYLRTLLIHGARAVLWRARKQTAESAGWLARLATRRNPNVAAVALANKNARIVWALLAHGREYQAGYSKKLETLAA